MANMTISLRLMVNSRGDDALQSNPTVRHAPSAGGRHSPGSSSGGPDPAAGGGRG
jgi:hypothetical protein